jgi:hypothetical protein
MAVVLYWAATYCWVLQEEPYAWLKTSDRLAEELFRLDSLSMWGLEPMAP